MDAEMGLLRDATHDGIGRVVVGAYIVNSAGEVLVLRRARGEFLEGTFELPSGGVEPGEDLETALRREIREETGLHVSHVGCLIGHFDYGGDGAGRARQFNFVANVYEPIPVQLSSEHDAYRWVSQDISVTEGLDDVLKDLLRGRLESRLRAGWRFRLSSEHGRTEALSQ
jgi:8-oxo-dGTP diphosphatase